MESKAGFSFVAQIVLTQKHPDFLLDQRVLFLGFTRQSTGSLTVSEVFHRFFVRKHERAIRQKNPNLEISRPLDESWLQATRSSCGVDRTCWLCYKNPQLREVFPSALELSQENGVFLSQSEWKMDGIGPWHVGRKSKDLGLTAFHVQMWCACPKEVGRLKRLND